MKKTVATLIAVIIAVAGLHAFRIYQDSKLEGTIQPSEKANHVWAVHGMDSLKFMPNDGSFSFTVNPGDWKIIINAEPPYEDLIFDTIVRQGQITQLGVVQLKTAVN